ncbi:hypothetical protein ACU60Q_15220 [Klebsiella aerogenes]
MTDITELALLVSKAKASVFTLEYISQFEPADIDSDDVDLRFEVDGMDTGTNVSIVDECGQAAKVIGVLVEALEKAQQSVELVDLQRDKIKRLESDLWDKEQLRKVHSEKSFELEGKVRELEARNQKDFVWRGKEISRLNDEVDELKEKLESRTVTVKLPPKIERNDADGWFMYNGGRVGGGAAEWYNKALDDVGAELTGAGIKWEAE